MTRAAVRAALTALLIAVAAAQAVAQQDRGRRLFPPEELGVLEGPDRDAWQKPDLVMDALRVGEGSVVADVGAGGGWFTVRLARRVGPNGTVYAQDVQPQMVEAIRRRVQREGLRNVEVRLGTSSSPNIPAGALDAVLIVDTYPEVDIDDRVTFLRNLAGALKPKGRLGIVNYTPGHGKRGAARRRQPRRVHRHLLPWRRRGRFRSHRREPALCARSGPSGARPDGAPRARSRAIRRR